MSIQSEFAMDMKPASIKQMKLLTLCGALPFYGAVGLVFSSIGPVDPSLIAVTYGAIIIAFLCGSHWGFWLIKSQAAPFNLMVISNIIALIAWAAPFAFNYLWALLVHSACFLTLLFVDMRLFKVEFFPAWYLTLRKQVTVLVIGAELLLIGSLGFL